MAAKQIVFSEEARRKLKNGMTVVANAVSATLGPKGRNVAIDRKFGSPSITHDGVSVAKEIELEDPFENMGAQLLKEAAQKMRESGKVKHFGFSCHGKNMIEVMNAAARTGGIDAIRARRRRTPVDRDQGGGRTVTHGRRR